MRQTNGHAVAKAGEGRKESADHAKRTRRRTPACGRTAQGASTSQFNAMCRNVKMGTTMSRTQACAISTVAGFFGINRVPRIASRVEQSTVWITMWRGLNTDTKRRVREVWRTTMPILSTIPLLERGNATDFPHHLVSSGSAWKPVALGIRGRQRLTQSRCCAFQQTHAVDQFLRDIELQVRRGAAEHARHGDRNHDRIFQ